jgi:threonine aldolase
MTNRPIDLRSDTLTRPTPGMREAMARAEVGDDVFGEDPTVNALQERAAALLGKEAALFVPSGSMANQVALLVHCRRGDEVIVGEGAHNANYEVGAGAALAGVQFAVAGRGGLYTAEEMAAVVRPPQYYYPRTSLACVENTHNRAGGTVWPPTQVAALMREAADRGIPLHLDGARIFNAAIALGRSARELAAGFASATFCLSKGLGAPIGSVLAGEREFVRQAHRFRKMLGGGMRQAGVLAAAGLYALEHHVERLAEDHANARRFADGLRGAPHARVVEPQTNIVMLELEPGAPLDGEALATRARARGVLFLAMGPRRVRVVTHLDVGADECTHAAAVVADILRAA